LETWKGSVWVTVATGINPMWRVAGAMRAATSTASRGRPDVAGRSARDARLRHQGVVNGEEVEQSTFGGGRQVAQ